VKLATFKLNKAKRSSLWLAFADTKGFNPVIAIEVAVLSPCSIATPGFCEAFCEVACWLSLHRPFALLAPPAFLFGGL
jgi:hypothetical protein